MESKELFESEERKEKALRALEGLDVDEIAAKASRHYAKGSPNPERYGCPPPGDLAGSVRHDRSPDPDTLAHLFECSECFVEYRWTLSQQQSAVAEPLPRIQFFNAWRFSVAAALVLTLAFGGWGLMRLLTPGQPEMRMAKATAMVMPIERGKAAPVAENAKPLPPPSAKRAQSSVTSKDSITTTTTAPIIRIDLDYYQSLREPKSVKAQGPADNEPSGGPQALLLPASRARLALRLPETGVSGEYTVSLVDAFDRILLSRHAISNDGAHLRVNFDLRRIPPEKYRLRVSREGEAPAYFDVIVKKP